MLFPTFEEISDPDEIRDLQPRLNRTHNSGPVKIVGDLVPGTHDHVAGVAAADAPCGSFDRETLVVLGRTLDQLLRTHGRPSTCVYHVWSGVLPKRDRPLGDLLLRGTIDQLGDLRVPTGHGSFWQEVPATLLADGLVIAAHSDVSELFIGSDLPLLPAIRDAGLRVRAVTTTTRPTFCR